MALILSFPPMGIQTPKIYQLQCKPSPYHYEQLDPEFWLHSSRDPNSAPVLANSPVPPIEA